MAVSPGVGRIKSIAGFYALRNIGPAKLMEGGPGVALFEPEIPCFPPIKCSL